MDRQSCSHLIGSPPRLASLLFRHTSLRGPARLNNRIGPSDVQIVALFRSRNNLSRSCKNPQRIPGPSHAVRGSESSRSFEPDRRVVCLIPHRPWQKYENCLNFHHLLNSSPRAAVNNKLAPVFPKFPTSEKLILLYVRRSFKFDSLIVTKKNSVDIL